MDTLVEISGLLFGCPLELTTKDCPFCELWNKPGIEKFNYLKSLNYDELKKLEADHRVCFEANAIVRKKKSNV